MLNNETLKEVVESIGMSCCELEYQWKSTPYSEQDTWYGCFVILGITAIYHAGFVCVCD